MSENDERILWRCAAQASNTKKKCPARIVQYLKRGDEPVFVFSRDEHIHAVLKRGPYNTSKKYVNPFAEGSDPIRGGLLPIKREEHAELS